MSVTGDDDAIQPQTDEHKAKKVKLNPISASCVSAPCCNNQCIPNFASFFEIVNPSMEPNSEHPSFSIPKAFLKRFRMYLGSTIQLESPGGQVWTTRLEADSSDSLRITTGWKEFACYMEVQSGDLMIFDLVSKCHFKVYIYEGRKFCEKAISFKSMLTKDNDKKKVDELCKHNDEAAKSHSCEPMLRAPKLNVYNGNPTSISQNKDNGSDCDKCAWQKGSKGNEKFPFGPFSGTAKFNKNQLSLDSFWQIWKHFHTETQEAFKCAIGFMSTNPFTILLMTRSNVCFGFKMSLPRAFARQYLSKGTKEIALLDEENKGWAVTWLGCKGNDVSFSGGWRHFAVDHTLKCGDICIFELIRMDSIAAFRVHIYRVSPADALAITNTLPSKFSRVLVS